MVAAGATCVVVDLGDSLAIVTDHDIRTRVVAAGAAPDIPLADVMTAPARTVTADRTASEALLEMLDHGIRHLPVLDARGRLAGVIDDVDLLAAEHRAPFRVRALIARAGDPGAVAAAAAALRPTAVALHDAGVAAPAVSRMLAALHDTITRRLIELALGDLGRRAGAVHVARARQLRPARAVPELRRRLRARLGGRGRSCAARAAASARRPRARRARGERAAARTPTARPRPAGCSPAPSRAGRRRRWAGCASRTATAG